MKIKSIKKLKENRRTGDIEVENTHSYQLSNGCVSHNTVSQLVNSSSGIHARYSKYYMRSVRMDKKDPLCQFMIDKGFPCEDAVNSPDHIKVFYFPIESPNSNTAFRSDLNCIDQLEIWKMYQDYWCEHKPSATIYVKEHEWMKTGSWVYDNFDDISGISFLPFSEHSYLQPPYQEITEAEYKEAIKKMPQDINWAELKNYEKEDNTSSSQELSCVGNTCDLIDTV